MSVENVKKFYEAVVQDKTIQQRFSELNQKYQGVAVDAAKADAIMEQELLPVAKELGYEFTLAEVKTYGEEMQQTKTNGELSDSELEAVAGGALCIFGLGFDLNTRNNCVILGNS